MGLKNRAGLSLYQAGICKFEDMNGIGIQQGIDNLVAQKYKGGLQRIGLVTNNAAFTAESHPSRIALINQGYNLVKLFSPEHGLNAAGADGAFQNNMIDPLTKLPVISLYGESLAPPEESLRDIDIVLFDIPDVGCRFYTYLWTMTYVMESCAAFNKPLLILDRTNPIGGRMEFAEGPQLDESKCSSFIGRWNIPVRHCCTTGELAKYFTAAKVPGLELEIIKASNWDRESFAPDSSSLFIPPSPAIRDMETAFLYPGMGLLEGINVNEGRGTATPFKLIGAPWMNTNELQKKFEILAIKGIKTELARYSPVEGIYAGEVCEGIRLAITDYGLFRPVRTGLQLIALIKSLYPDDCCQRLYPTRANPTGENHLDRLTGVVNSFDRVEELLEMAEDVGDWKDVVGPFLLY